MQVSLWLELLGKETEREERADVGEKNLPDNMVVLPKLGHRGHKFTGGCFRDTEVQLRKSNFRSSIF